MSTKNTIEFVEWQQHPVPYSPRWWERTRWWLVRLLGGECPLDTVKVVRVPVNGKTFIDRLYKQKRYLFDRFNCEAKTLLMGGEDYEELMRSPAVNELFRIHAEYNYGREIYGLTIKVIPWMRGILVMP